MNDLSQNEQLKDDDDDVDIDDVGLLVVSFATPSNDAEDFSFSRLSLASFLFDAVFSLAFVFLRLFLLGLSLILFVSWFSAFLSWTSLLSSTSLLLCFVST